MRTVSRIALAGLAACLSVLASTPAKALVLKTWDGPTTSPLVNITPPADDPVWSNLAENRAATYLGNNWVLAAEHNGGDNSVVIAGSTFQALPGTSRLLSNPDIFTSSRRQSTGSLTADSDLRLFRIGLDENGMTPEDLDASIRQIHIADRLPNTSTEELTLFGRGRRRFLNNNNKGPTGNGQFSFNSDGNQIPYSTSSSYRGFDINPTSPDLWQWGTNKRVGSLSGAVSNGTNLLIEADNLPEDTVGFAIRFDESGLHDEAQGAGGDSGGPVFWKEDGEWVLAGLMHAVYPANDNLNLLGAFGSHTVISDLSYSTYKQELDDLFAADLFGAIGDIDLDGSITGSIVNGEATGDLAVLVDNWGYQAAEADIHTWLRGDLNRDAQVDIGDFVLLRNALNGSISSSSFALLLAASAIPEPTTALLTSIGLLALSARRPR